MKGFLTSVVLLSGASAAHAQLLLIPGQQNSDWVLMKTEPRPYGAQATQIPPPPATDRMPNAGQKSIKSNGDHCYYWAADRRLAYDWFRRDGKLEPSKIVTVREQRKDVVYVYRQAK